MACVTAAPLIVRSRRSPPEARVPHLSQGHAPVAAAQAHSQKLWVLADSMARYSLCPGPRGRGPPTEWLSAFLALVATVLGKADSTPSAAEHSNSLAHCRSCSG
ncbi:hypothetical protein NDU88_006047 [Pleurodeles waltl]|uniref:Uncharacterized protein n=1 Tax=Pleurodeles waltl TaxID=8319 RepID=A0AAV7RLE4_PLEWA|nr:hypothetical protein NDU88_006047 [Pleurodeles waltl]